MPDSYVHNSTHTRQHNKMAPVAAANVASEDPEFPCSLYVIHVPCTPPQQSLQAQQHHIVNKTDGVPDRVIDLPLPTARLASSALKALRVDEELSPLVRREFSVVSPAAINAAQEDSSLVTWSEESVLRAEYKATTNRMLRVAVNGLMESLGVVLGVMEELDVDVLGAQS